MQYWRTNSLIMAYSNKKHKIIKSTKATIDEQSQNNVTKAAYENHNRYRPRTG